MAGNTVTNTRTVVGRKKVVQYITILSDGTEETGTVVYDSSAVASALGLVDPLTCTIRDVKYVASGNSTIAHLLFDATTDVVAMSLPYSAGGATLNMDFKEIGGLHNTGGTGRTGDILLTTTGLNSGDTITLILTIDPEVDLTV
jgi:hypothetical protein